MIRYYSVGEAARLIGESARRTSDGFHKNWFDNAACPLVGGRRMIPAEYLPALAAILRERRVKVRPDVPGRCVD
jgi:hypothetical protein